MCFCSVIKFKKVSFLIMYCTNVCMMCVLFPDDIEVIFYEDKNDGMNVQPWMAKGRFGPNDVHHQVANALLVVFLTAHSPPLSPVCSGVSNSFVLQPSY